MIMRLWRQLLIILITILLLDGCGGGGGSPASPPVIGGSAGDGQYQLTWTPISGIYYWVWYLQSPSSFSIDNIPNAPFGSATAVLPTYVVPSLTNGLPYSVVVNAHAGNANGPGGPQSNGLILTPRLAGSTWTSCTSNCPATVMNAVTFGDSSTFVANTNSIHVYVAVGNTGSIYTSPDGLNWTAQTQSCAGNNTLYGADYNNGTFNVVGANGTICFNSQSVGSNTSYGLTNSIDASGKWAPQNAVWTAALTKPIVTPQPTLYAVAANESLYNYGQTNNIVVGSTGTIWYSTDGANWLAVSSGTSNDLHAVTYTGNCGLTSSNQWVAVGANGTIVHTTDGSGQTSWSTITQGSGNLKGVACSPNTTPYTISNGALVGPNATTPVVVVVGDSGTLLTSLDGTNWTDRTSTLSSVFNGDNLTAVYAFNRNIENRGNNTQFVVTGVSGKVYTSLDGVNWVVNTASTSALNAVVTPQGTLIPNGDFGAVPFTYVAVGGSSAGTSAISQ